MLRRFEAELRTRFDTHELGQAAFFLDIAVERNRSKGQIKIHQRRLTAQLLNTYGMQRAKGKQLPMAVATQLRRNEGDPLDRTAHSYYSHLVGTLLYLAACTRPDIAQAVGVLRKYMPAPTTVHWQAAKGVLRYLAAPQDQGIQFGSDPGTITGWCDADYIGDPDTRKSTSGFVFTVHGGAVTWLSKRQSTVALSTTEAEYMPAAAAAAREAIWLRTLLQDLGISVSTLQIYASDNQSALKLLKNPVPSDRAKHIDVQYHFAREKVASREIS